MMWKMGIEKQIHNAPIQNAQPRIKNEKSARINTAAKNKKKMAVDRRLMSY